MKYGTSIYFVFFFQHASVFFSQIVRPSKSKGRLAAGVQNDRLVSCFRLITSLAAGKTRIHKKEEEKEDTGDRVLASVGKTVYVCRSHCNDRENENAVER